MTALCTEKYVIFLFNHTATTETYTLSLHDALPICEANLFNSGVKGKGEIDRKSVDLLNDLQKRSEEHTSELQSRRDLVCRLLLEKKKKIQQSATADYQRSQLPHKGSPTNPGA